MSRLSLSDALQVQERLMEAQRAQNAELAGMLAAALAALTERRTPTESVTVKRTGTGQNPTAVEVTAHTRNGETVHDAAERARAEYELLSARFPLPSGAAHAAELGPWPGAE
jgi:septal ring-binding cell division protein DamX